MATGAMVTAVAPNYPVLFGARILMGLGAALASPMILALSSTLVEPHQQGRALATVMMGITVASVVTVPASTWAAARIGPVGSLRASGLLLLSPSRLSLCSCRIARPAFA